MQARIAMLLKRSPIPGQAFCQYLVSSFCSDSAEEEEDAPLQGFRSAIFVPGRICACHARYRALNWNRPVVEYHLCYVF